MIMNQTEGDWGDGEGMAWCRLALKRLGWPIDSLSDEGIVRELYARWFAQTSERIDPMPALSSAAANGIVATMANEGNLDALCWCESNLDSSSDPIEPIAAPFYERRVDNEATSRNEPKLDRRKANRTPRSDLIRFTFQETGREAGGWLVEASADGLAFITEAKDVPGIGTWIDPTLCGRDSEAVSLGTATVVRTELLTDFLGLVCAKLGDSWETSDD